MLFKQKDPNSLDIESDIEERMNLQKKSLCTSPDKMFGYMWYLIRNRLDLNQSEMGLAFHSNYKAKYKTGLSKSAYSKIENGQTSINFDLVFIFSSRYGVKIDWVYQLYSYLLKFANDHNCIYVESCGEYGYGRDNRVDKPSGSSNDYLYTELKHYSKFFSESDLEPVYKYIDEFFAKAKEIVNFMKVSKAAQM